jgi:hypothetical protein
MSEFDDIDSLKIGKEKQEKFIEYYKNKVKIDDWLNNSSKNSIINFKDRTEYKKNNQYHRLNGPAIEYHDYNGQTNPDQYYYKGEKFETKEDWKKATIKEVRKIKIKKLNKTENPD